MAICKYCRAQADINSRLTADKRIPHQCDDKWKRIVVEGVTKTTVKVVRRIKLKRSCTCQCRIATKVPALTQRS